MHLPLKTQFRLCCVLLALTITACQKVQPQNQRPTPLQQDPLVQVYFNHVESSEYTEPYRNSNRPGDDLEQQIVDAIFEAKSTVDVAVQELRLPKIAQALIQRQKAGVKVRVILENSYSRPWSSFAATELAKLDKRERDRYNEFRQLADSNKDGILDQNEINKSDALVILRNAKTPLIDDTADGSKGSSLMHHKFVIVDNRIVIVTSANFTTSDIHGDFISPSSLGNANNLLKIDSPELAALFAEEFNLMWGDGLAGDSKFGLKKPLRQVRQIQLGDTTVKVQFSPTSPTQPWSKSSNGLIGETLNLAEQSVDMALFVFSDQRLANILETNHQKSVQIRALIDPNFAYRFYSDGLDLMGVALANNCKYKIDNKPWKEPITNVGIPLLPKGDLLHHKFGVVDKQIVITGSHNWSEAANSGNDETVLVINSPRVAAHFEREFERLYADSQLGVPSKVQQKVKAEQKQCATASKQTSQGTFGSNVDKKIYPANSLQTSQKVNLNTASLEELETLPGVGAKLAQRIIETRQQQRFTSLEDLYRVPGVGASLLEKLRDHVTW